jgi:hypothetical protein
MTKQTLDIGTNANDGTGDTLRSGGQKINDNFSELYLTLGGNSIASNGINAAYATQTIDTASATVNDSDTLIIFNKGSGTIAATLGDGTSTGQYKIFLNKNTGVATVTPSVGKFANGTNFKLSQYGSTQAIWEGSKWYLIGHKDSADTDVVIT